MASTSQAGSGGKIVKSRRIATKKTPYDRHTSPESPNWFNGLVSPAKFVAGGASKLLSSFWNPKGWASNSDTDSDSEGVIEADHEDNENLTDAVELNQKKGSSSGKSEILYLIEQLLMLESFSREECNRLIEIVNSRLVDSTLRDGVDAELKSPDTYNQAIKEARKLITKSDLDSTNGSKSLATPNKDYLSGGSSNIQEEIWRLRSKVTEDILTNHQSPKPEEKTTDTRTIQEDLPIEALSSLPTIEEQNQVVDVDTKNPKASDEIVDMITQGSSNTSDSRKTDSPTRRPVTRSRRRGRGGK